MQGAYNFTLTHVTKLTKFVLEEWGELGFN